MGRIKLDRVFHAGFSQKHKEHREVIVIVVGRKDAPRIGPEVRCHKSLHPGVVERTGKSDTLVDGKLKTGFQTREPNRAARDPTQASGRSIPGQNISR